MEVYSKKLLQIIEIKKHKKSISNYFRNVELKELLSNETSFLNYNARNTERLWYVENNIFTQVKCPICDEYSRPNVKLNYIKCCSRKCSSKIINPENGLTSAQETMIKSAATMSVIDPKSGVSIYDNSAIKHKKTKSKINPLSGNTFWYDIAQKTKNTLNEIDPITGLSGHDKKIIKINEIKSKIDPITGLTGFQIAGKKIKNTNSKINSITGLSNYQSASRTILINSYNKKSLIFPKKYKLITRLDEYIKSNRLLKYSCNKCGSIRESYWPYIRCLKCIPYNKSIGENEVLEYCQSLIPNIISNSRSIINPQELDIHIPDHNLAIEYDGLYWHSSDSVESENKNYHLHKTQECEKQGIHLFHIFENEWLNPKKQKIWKSIIKNKLGKSERIYARKTEVRSVSSKDKTEFLNSNHLQGNVGSSVNLGLYLGDELVSLMTFGRSRYNKKVDWELIRFCNRLGTSVVGGASRLLKAFRREHNGSIISYADKRRSNGNLYKQLGFEFSHDSKPNYWYWKDSMNLESRLKYQKHKLKDQLDVFDPDLTESENMYQNGYRKIYDCGNQVWKLG